MLTNLISLVGKVAPLLASLLGSPIAGIGVSWLASMFGADPKNTQDIVDKLTSDPAYVAKLRQIEYEHSEELAKIASANYGIEVDDRKNARARELATRDHVPTVLAIGFLIAYAAIQSYCVMHPLSATDIISARFQDVLIMIISYYFGSMNTRSTK